MHVFVTGATGYVGAAVCEELLRAGHRVSGLARSDAAIGKLRDAGVSPVSGNLNNLAVLRDAARDSDFVIHAAMEWGPQAAPLDAAAVQALLDAGRPLVYSSGTWVIGDTKQPAGELALLRPPPLVAWRPAVEKLALDAKGIVIRAARVFGRGAGAIGAMVKDAREKGVVRIVGDGQNHWSFVHVESLANLYRLAVEQAPAGELFLAAEGPPFRVIEVAETIAEVWKCRIERVPVEEARRQMGPIAEALALDQRVVSTKAGRVLGWNMRRPNVIQEILRGSYSPAAASLSAQGQSL